MAKNSKIKVGLAALGLGILLGIGTPAIAQETNENLTSNIPLKQYFGFQIETLENSTYNIKIGIKYGTLRTAGNSKIRNAGGIIITGDKRYPNVETKSIRHFSTFDPTKVYVYTGNDLDSKTKKAIDTILAEEAYKYIHLKKPEKKPDMGKLVDILIDALFTEKIEV